MTLTITLVVVVAFASLASTVTVQTYTPELADGSAPQDDYIPSESVLEARDSYQPYQQPLLLNFQLPSEEQNPVPFYAPEPATYLKPPPEIQEPNQYEVPVPAQELVAPIETVWNPDNDPNLYYEVPAVLTKQELPTKGYPKKYNKDIHSKDKPYSLKPKQEIVIDPIDDKQYESKQKELHKVFQQMAKKENQKQIDAEKVTKTNTTDEVKQQTDEAGTDNETNNNSEGAADIIEAPSEPHKQELDTKLTPSHIASSDGDRINFHIVGHDGPHSYKWGFDTGKGYNRQFRYEEKDKTGLVKGHYGFYDKNGKLQIVHYDSHPRVGFRAEGNFGKV